MYLLTLTVPARATRPRSLRPRSTSITCSARSFGSRWSSSASSASSLASTPRGRVPAMGWVVSRSPSTWSSSSGRRADDLEGWRSDEEQVRAGVDPAQRPVQSDPVERPPVAGSVGRSNDWRRARTTWIASPAAIASLATSTAWMYSSRPRLVPAGRPSALAAGGVAGAPFVPPLAIPRHLGLGRPRAALERLEDRPPRRSGSATRGRARRYGARRSPTGCGSGGRRRGRGRSR